MGDPSPRLAVHGASMLHTSFHHILTATCEELGSSQISRISDLVTEAPRAAAQALRHSWGLAQPLLGAEDGLWPWVMPIENLQVTDLEPET